MKTRLFTIFILWCFLTSLSAKMPALGFFAHEGGGIALDSLRAWDTRLDCEIRVASVFLPKDTWADIGEGTWAWEYWTGWVNEQPGRRLLVSVPMIVSGANILAGANGDYNQHFRSLAENLMRYDLENAIIRLGWEMNGDWYGWFIGQDSVSWNAWTEFWRQAVTAMRGVPGQKFKFDWTPNNGGSVDADWEDFYPGDAYVDIIGIDVYDWLWNRCDASWEELWAHHKYQGDPVNGGSGRNMGLLGHANFAQKHGKPMSIPEWGLVDRNPVHCGGGDDTLFMDSMAVWLENNNLAYHVYFNSGDNVWWHTLNEFPLSRQIFIDKVGGSCREAGLEIGEPPGGWMLEAGRSLTIAWTGTDLLGGVSIDYTTDGETWQSIIDSTENDGEHIWTVPDSPGDSVKIRIWDLFGDVVAETDSFLTIIEAQTAMRAQGDPVPFSLHIPGGRVISRKNIPPVRTVFIRNTLGELIRELPASENSVFWDGRTVEGITARPGLYLVEFQLEPDSREKAGPRPVAFTWLGE